MLLSGSRDGSSFTLVLLLIYFVKSKFHLADATCYLVHPFCYKKIFCAPQVLSCRGTCWIRQRLIASQFSLCCVLMMHMQPPITAQH